MPSASVSRTAWIDHLRSFITLLVIAHHAALAYTSFSIFNPSVYILSTHPVVDKTRWPALDYLVSFNDTFFMPLMFLISGLFVPQAIKRKGAQVFIKDRFRRLFVPFLFAVTILMPIAYYPAWLLSGRSDLKQYLIDFFTTEGWPVGPPWFIWLLFFFNLLVILLPKHIPRPRYPLITLITITVILYVPAAVLFGSFTWTGIGPFDFQKSRFILYLGYFLFGAVMGAGNLDKHLTKWPLWMCAAIILFIAHLQIPSPVLFALTTAASSIAFLSLFKALSKNDRPIWRSLSANAYGMYLTHYIFVVWCQYALTNINCPAAIKFLLTFVISTFASWSVTQLFKKQTSSS